MGSIYFIECQVSPNERGPIKIGWSANPSQRFESFDKPSPFPLKLLCQAEGTVADERKLHKMFAEWRMRGEWFEPAHELLTLVSRTIDSGTLPFPSEPHSKREQDQESKEAARIRTLLAEYVRKSIDVYPGERAIAQQERAAKVLGITYKQAWRMWHGRGAVILYPRVVDRMAELGKL